LSRGFDDNLGVLRRFEGCRRAKSREQVTPFRRRYHALRRLSFRILLDRRHAAAERIGGDIDQHRLPPVLRKHVRDAVAHRPRSHHRDATHPASHVRGWVNLVPITASVPAISTIVATIPPSGPNAPPSTHACAPGAYSPAGTWNRSPLTGASNRSASPAS